MAAVPIPVQAHSPTALDEALALRADPRWLVVAGGTDVYPAHVSRPIGRPLLDLSRLDVLRAIEDHVDAAGRRWLRIGGLVSWTQLRALAQDPGLRALAQAAAEVGGLQIQNQATIGGNLCNASPAADGVPALLALGAEVELASARGIRRLPLEQFVLGNRRTALATDELLTAIELPRPSARAVSQFLKLGHRRYLVISIAMVAVQLDLDEDSRIVKPRVAVGACSAAARRLEELEALLVGLAAGAAASEVERLLVPGGVGARAVEPAIAPIDDVRGTADYRRDAARELIRRALVAALDARSQP
jgi:CO/xanthine dehydrogenase FAD-binding subunit